MKTNLLTVMLAMLIGITAKGQTINSPSTIDSLANFNEQQWRNFYLSNHTSLTLLPEFIQSHQRDYLRDTYYPSQRIQGQAPTPQQACTNIDFESGNLNGWTRSTGYNPGYNATGCCASAGGAQVITSGAGTDGCGGFPVVSPGGSFSVKLGNNGTGGIADRLEQTFSVTSANANFTYRYAVVFEDPGHAVVDQPSFQIDMVDSNGVQIPCTYYNVAAGQNIPGFVNSTSCANVVYKPWTSVSVDLQAFIGQNVTIRFTTYDCALGGHYAYAYIDGSCSNYGITRNGILCQGSTVQLLAPPGFAAYNWTLPDGSAMTGQNITTGMAGNYVLNLTMVTGCPGPTINYSLSAFPKPVAAFTASQLTPCTSNISFTNSSTVSSGYIYSNDWNLGDGNTGTTSNATHTYGNIGVYNVQLITTSDMGCKDTMMLPVTISPLPVADFTANTACANGTTTFTNTSAISTGSLSTYNWQFGDGGLSSLNQPTHQYATAGNYVVTLTVTSNNNCTNSISHTVSVNPLPAALFTAVSVCDGLPMNFTNNSTITSGSITNYTWDFESNGSIDATATSPNHLYTGSGTYVALLTATSNNNCVASYSQAVTVHPNPVVQFSATSVCDGVPVSFTNQSSITSGQINSYNWNFGDNTTATLPGPIHTYAADGTYNITLTATSNFNCVNAASGNAVVYPKPAVQFAAQPVCFGFGTSFTNQSAITSGQITSYAWTFGDNTTGAGATPTHQYAAAGNYNVSLSATSNFNCSNNSSGIVTVYEKPVAGFVITQLTACTQTVAFINASHVNGGTIAANNWDFGNGGTATSQNAFENYAGSGSYNVQLITTSNNGCKDTILQPLTISPLPTAAFAANNACFNSMTTFTNVSSVSTGSVINCNWQFGDGTISAATNPAHQYTSTGSFPVTLIVMSDKNCVNAIMQFVTVNPLPNVSFTSQNVCMGAVTNYTNNTSISSGSIAGYSWDFNSDGTADASSQNVNTLFAAPGTYTTQLTATSNNNCTAAYSLPVIVHPNPVAQFSVAAVCQGQATAFSNQSTGATQYSWTMGDGGTAVAVNPSHMYAAYGNYNVTLTATNSFNCSHSVSGLSVVNPKPVVNFQSTTTCHNQATQFTNLSSIAAGSIIKYRWDFDNNGTPDDSTANPTYVYPLAGTAQSKMTAISNNQCANQIISPVVVHFNPVANFSSPSTCLPDATQFNDLSVSNDGAITAYSWDFNGDNVFDNVQQNPQYIYSQTGNYGVKLEVQTQYGCVNTIIKSAYVNATPSVLFAAQNNVGCPSLCVKFTNNSTISSGQIVTYQWFFGDNSGPDYTQNPTHCYGTGNYNVTLKAISDSGCVSSSMLPNLVNAYPVPVADFAVTPTEVEITEPLIEVADKSVGASTVMYDMSDGTHKTDRNFAHTFVTNDAKTILIMQRVSNTYGCRDSIVKDVVIKPAYVLFIPNAFTPNSDGLNDGFKAVGIGVSQFKLQVFDRWGALIFESDDINKAWDGSVRGKGDFDSTKEEVYVWKAHVTDVLQNTHDLIGHVTLLK